jgi:hypothetical protein
LNSVSSRGLHPDNFRWDGLNSWANPDKQQVRQTSK